MLFNFYILSLHVAALAGIINWNKLKNNYFRLFIVYLNVILILDAYLKIHRLLTDDENLWPIYSMFFSNHVKIPLQFIFFSWLYFKKLEKYKLMIKIGFFIYFCAWLIEAFLRFDKGYITYFTYSYEVGSLWMLILALLYFIDIMRSDRIIDFMKERFFYVSLGILIFYVVSMPLQVFDQVFIDSEFTYLKNMNNKYTKPFNSAMYLLFAASFIWGTRN